MDTPMPIPLDRLKAILGNSKKIMEKVDEKDEEKLIKSGFKGKKKVQIEVEDDYDEPTLLEELEREPAYKTPDLSAFKNTGPTQYTEEQVRNSKFPEAVKKSLLEGIAKRQKLVVPGSFSAGDVKELITKPKQQPKQQIKESNEIIGITRAEVKKMIDESINEYFSQVYNKNLTEAAISQTIKTLIKEGKINVKKKI